MLFWKNVITRISKAKLKKIMFFLPDSVDDSHRNIDVNWLLKVYLEVPRSFAEISSELTDN